jgi:hypothetical protein
VAHRMIEAEISRIPAGARMVINHSSCQRPYFHPGPEPEKREEDYVCVFTLEVDADNIGFMYINHFPTAVHVMEVVAKTKWLFEHMPSASFIKSHPLK